MNRRCLSTGKANLTEINISLRDNIHKHHAFLYEFAQDASLSDEIKMALTPIIYLKYLMLLSPTYGINNNLHLGDLESRIDKFIKSENINSLAQNTYMLCTKYIKAEDAKLALESDILIKYLMHLKSEQANLSIEINALNLVNTIFLKCINNMSIDYDISLSIDKSLKSDIVNAIFSDVQLFSIKYAKMQDIKNYFALGFIRDKKTISNFQDMLIEDFANLTIEEITKADPAIYGLLLLYKVYIKTAINLNLKPNICFSIDTLTKANSNISLTYNLLVNILKKIELDQIKSTLDLGKVNIINQKNIKSTSNLCLSINKLNMGLVRMKKIKDLEGLTLSDIEGMTIDELCYVRLK